MVFLGVYTGVGGDLTKKQCQEMRMNMKPLIHCSLTSEFPGCPVSLIPTEELLGRTRPASGFCLEIERLPMTVEVPSIASAVGSVS